MSNPGLPIIYSQPFWGGAWMQLQAGSYGKMSAIPTSAVPQQSGVTQGTGGPTTYNFNKFGSMKIPAGYTVQVYTEPFFYGTMTQYVGPLISATPGADVWGNSNNAANFSIKVLGGPLTGLTGTQVSGTLKQTDAYLQYQNGDCSCCSSNDGCPNGDWVLSHTSCGRCCVQTQPVCSVLDSALCPVIGQGASAITWAVSNGISDQPSALVKCSYDLAEFKTGADVNNFLNGPWISTDPTSAASPVYQYNNTIMPYFCGQQVTTCPIDPSTQTSSNPQGTPMPQCSRFVSTAPDGSAAACTAWITAGLAGTSGFNSSAADGAMANYCTTYKTPDCDCVNRASDPAYMLVAPQMKGNDGCWWLPCRLPNDYLVPSTENSTTVYSKQPCPSSCSVNINNIANNYSVVTTGQIEAKVNCTFSNPTTPPPTSTTTTSPPPVSPGPPGSPPGSPPVSPVSPSAPPVSPATSAKKGISPLIWVGVAVGVLLLIIIVVVVIVMMSRKKPPVA